MITYFWKISSSLNSLFGGIIRIMSGTSYNTPMLFIEADLVCTACRSCFLNWLESISRLNSNRRIPISIACCSRLVGSTSCRRCWWEVDRSLSKIPRLGGGPSLPGSHESQVFILHIGLLVISSHCSKLKRSTIGAMIQGLSLTASENRLMNFDVFTALWTVRMTNIFGAAKKTIFHALFIRRQCRQ